MIRGPSGPILFPYTTLFRSVKEKYEKPELGGQRGYVSFGKEHAKGQTKGDLKEFWHFGQEPEDRKSTRLNSSHVAISYAVFCLKKKNLHREAVEMDATLDEA